MPYPSDPYEGAAQVPMARCRESARHRPLETDPRAVCKLARSYDRRHSVRLGKFSRLSPITCDDECCQKCCRPNVISVVCEGGVYHGFAVDSRGVFIHDNEHGAGVKRYAGRIGSSGKGYMVSSLGVLTLRPGHGIGDANHASGLDEALPGLWTTEDRRVPRCDPDQLQIRKKITSEIYLAVGSHVA